MKPRPTRMAAVATARARSARTEFLAFVKADIVPPVLGGFLCSSSLRAGQSWIHGRHLGGRWNRCRLELQGSERNEAEAAGPPVVHLVPAHEQPGRLEARVERRRGTGQT